MIYAKRYQDMRHFVGGLVFLVSVFLALAVFTPPVWADSNDPATKKGKPSLMKDIWTRSKLTGDWGGLRTYLTDHGIGIEIRLAQFGQWVTSGGIDTNGEYGGKVDYRLNVDATKLFGLWKGVSLNMHAETRYGYDILEDAGSFALPNAPMLYPGPGKYHGTEITGLTVTQSLFDGRADVFFGKMHAFDLATGLFPQVAGGLEGFWNVNSLVTAMPWFRYISLSMFGGGGWTIKDGMVQAGLLVLGTENATTTWNNFSDSFEDGPGLFGFYRFFYKVYDKPGYVLFAAGGSTKKYQSMDPSSWTIIPGEGLTDTNSKRTWDFATYLYQVFWQAEGNDKRRAQFFMGGTVADEDPTFSNWNLFASVEAFGLMASRPHDRMGISGWYTGISADFDRLTSDLGIRLRDSWGCEIYYNFEINPWLHMSPDLQVIKNENIGDSVAVIPGIRLVIDL